MKVFLNSLGGLLFLTGVGWAIYIVVAVATHREGFTTLTELIPALAFHAGVLFAGMVCIGLGQRIKKSA
ncbi:hypothetical protein ACFLVZ_03290 [Chloroflexota bacterium]